jgi:hypothetical protein
MTCRSLATLLLGLLLAGQTARSQECPTWQQLLEEESISTVGIGAIGPKLGVSVWFVYLNPDFLGECVLGKQSYAELRQDALKDKTRTHGFWVGASGPYASAFRAEDHYLVQADRKLKLAARQMEVEAMPIEGAPKMKTQYLVFFEGELDFRDPVTIFFIRGDGTYGTEYWLNDKYLP